MHKNILPKKKGSRFDEVKTLCIGNELVGLESIKSSQETGLETDEFVHILKSSLANYAKPVVVKIHDSMSIYVNKELLAIEELSGFKNVVKSICHFSCLDNKSRWEKPIESEVKFCSNDKDKLHFFVYEYIENGDIEDFFTSNPSLLQIKSIFIQSALVIMILGKKYKIIHGDLNSGNILFEKTNKKSITYELDDLKYTLDTNGRIPKLIDFGRCKKLKGNVNESVMDDVYILLDILSIWIKDQTWKTSIREFLLGESNKKNNKMRNFIENLDNFFTSFSSGKQSKS
jgi:serine/threonine protein kinase